jgi:hypothetical protein
MPPIYPLTCISNLTCRLSRQDPYHVPNHHSWWDLFYILNQLNKVRHVRPGSNDFMDTQSSFIPLTYASTYIGVMISWVLNLHSFL